MKELLGANKPVRDAEWTAKEVRAAAAAAAGICSSGLSYFFQLLHAHTQLPAPFPVLRPTCCPKTWSAFVRTIEPLALIFPPHPKPPPNPKQVELIMEKMPNLLTSKPVIYLVNMSATDYTRKKNKWLPKIHAWIQEHGGGVMIPFSVEFEAKLWEMRDNPSAKEVSRRQDTHPPDEAPHGTPCCAANSIYTPPQKTMWTCCWPAVCNQTPCSMLCGRSVWAL